MMEGASLKPMTPFRQEDQFQAFVAEHRPLWLKLAGRVLENKEEAEDVVQETLVILWKKRDDLEVENPGAYAARAVWLNAIKRKTREGTPSPWRRSPSWPRPNPLSRRKNGPSWTPWNWKAP